MRGVKPVCSAVLARLANDTCTAREQHLYGSRATLVWLTSDACVPVWHCLLGTLALLVRLSDIICRVSSHYFLFLWGRMVVSVCKEALDGRKVKLSDVNYGLYPPFLPVENCFSRFILHAFIVVFCRWMTVRYGERWWFTASFTAILRSGFLFSYVSP